MVLSLFKSSALLLLGLIWMGLLHAEPVLVLGSFTEKSNAANYLLRAEADLGKQAHLVRTLINGAPYFRVVVACDGLSIEEMKRRAVASGFAQPWSWNTRLSPTRAAAAEPVAPRSRQITPSKVNKPAPKTNALANSIVTSEVVSLDSDGVNVDILIPQIENLPEPMIMDGRLDESIWLSLIHI